MDTDKEKINLESHTWKVLVISSLERDGSGKWYISYVCTRCGVVGYGIRNDPHSEEERYCYNTDFNCNELIIKNVLE